MLKHIKNITDNTVVKMVSLSVGVTIILSSLLIEKLIGEYTRFNDVPLNKGQAHYLDASTYADSIMPGSFQNVSVYIEYFSEMKKNEYSLVELSYDVTVSKIDPSVNRVLPAEHLSVDENKSVVLQSPSFDISGSKINILKDEKLPIKIVWAVKPKAEGTHLFLIDISELVSSISTFKMLEINGNNTTINNPKYLELPVKVYTYWGISQRTLQIMKIIAYFIGALLTYPIIVDVIKSRFTPPKKIISNRVVKGGGPE